MTPGVLGLVGTSYCGSTLLELTLATHPQITTVGEIRVVSPEPWARRTWAVCCSTCRGGDCPVLPPAAMPVDLRTAYTRAAEVAGVPWVVDSSKYRGHFDGLLADGAEIAGLAIVSLIKRPEPQIGSLLKHHPDDDCAEMADTYCAWYDDQTRWLDALPPSVPWMVLPYDELTGAPDLAVARVLAMMDAAGLAPPLSGEVDLLRRCQDAHRIGGNSAVVYGHERPIMPDESWRNRDIARVTHAARRRMWATYYRAIEARARGFIDG